MKSLDKYINDSIKQAPEEDELQIAANCLNELVEQHGKDVFSKDYKTLLHNIASDDFGLQNLLIKLIKPRANKKYCVTEQSTNMIKLMACVKMLLNPRITNLFLGKNAKIINKVIDGNFTFINNILRQHFIQENSEFNQLQTASWSAKLSHLENFTLYCNEIEILKSILLQPLQNKFFFNSQTLKEKTIKNIAKKYGCYPNLILHENHYQYSYTNLSDNNYKKFKELLKDDLEIKMLVRIINQVETTEYKAETYKIIQNLQNLINYGALSYVNNVSNSTSDNIITDLTKELMYQDTFSTGALCFLSSYLGTQPSTTEIIKGQLQKLNNEKCLKILEEANNFGQNIKNELAAQPYPLASDIKMNIIAHYFYNNYKFNEAESKMDIVWSKLNKEEKIQTLRNALFNIGYDSGSKSLSKTTRQQIIKNLTDVKAINCKKSLSVLNINPQHAAIKYILKKIEQDPDLYNYAKMIIGEDVNNQLMLLLPDLQQENTKEIISD